MFVCLRASVMNCFTSRASFTQACLGMAAPPQLPLTVNNYFLPLEMVDNSGGVIGCDIVVCVCDIK